MYIRPHTYEEEEISYLKNNNTKKKINQPKLIAISFAKIISSYGVITLHINGFWKFHSNDSKLFMTVNFIETFFYYSVPVFVLCIGATLLNFNERYSIFEYNKKRFIKVFIPLLCWNIILCLYKVYFLKSLKFEKLNFINIWNYFFLSKISNIFNSLHIFLLTYMLIPLLAYVEKEKKMNIYLYYFFLLLFTQSVVPYLITIFRIKIAWIYKLKVGYLIYIFAGYIIHNYNFLSYQKFIIYLLGTLSFFIHLIGTKTMYFRDKAKIRLHKGYLNLPAILHSCAIFLFLKENSYFILKKVNKNIINNIASLTFGPFFLHYPILETIQIFPKLYNYLFFNTLLFSFFIFCLCLLISYILKKIPILRLLVP